MNLKDMIYAVKQGIQTMDAFTAELYLDEQITDIINEKIETFVKQQFFKNKVQLPDGTFEITKEGLNNLQTLINVITSISNTSEDYTKELDETVKFVISVDASINNMPLDAPVRIVPHEELIYLLRNPFRTSSILSPLATLQDNKLTVYVKRKFLLNSLKIIFIKEPYYFNALLLQSEYDKESNLPSHVHQTIVDMVVQSILEKNESPRYQQNVNENILNK